MGWLFTQNASRKDIIDKLVKFEENDAGVWKTLRHCARGNVLWTVLEWTDKNSGDTRTVIGCHLLQKSVEKFRSGRVVSWGYKSMDESMHPCYYTCPLSYLDAVPVACEEWREQVRQYNRKYNIGDRLALTQCKIPYVDVIALRPLTGRYQGFRYRIPKDRVSGILRAPS